MSHRKRNRLRLIGEYAAMRLVELLLWPLPVSAGIWLGRRLGSLAWLVDRRHRVVAEANVQRALGLDPGKARALVHRLYRNMGANTTEDLMLARTLRRKPLTDFSEMEGSEHIQAALARGRGAIVITAHLGNWELGGFGIAHMAGSVLVVARQLSNPHVEAYLQRWRRQAGLAVVDRRGALRHVVRRLRDGGCVAMLIDQNQRRGGVFVPFFGRLASTVPSAASIALKYDVPVLAGYTYRVGAGAFHCFHLDPPFELIRTGDHDADVVANTAQFTRRLEEVIRRHPDQWLWLHSRWKRRPPGEQIPDAAAPAAPDGSMESSDP